MKYYFVHDGKDNHLYVAANEDNARRLTGIYVDTEKKYLYELTPNKFDSEGWLMTAK